MSAVLPTLTQWIENHITSIYQATSQDTSNALNNFLSKDATITVNGKVISRDDTAKQLQLEKFLEIGASVKFTDTVEVPTDKSNTVEVIGLRFHSNSKWTDELLSWRSFRLDQSEFSTPSSLQKRSESEMHLRPTKSPRLSMLCMFLIS